MENSTPTDNALPSIEGATHYHTTQPPIVVPEDVDSERKPQLNETICRCGCNCRCSLSRGGEDSDSDPGDLTHGESEESSDDVSLSMIVQEEMDYNIEVGDLGMISIREIIDALARRTQCTCHHGDLSSASDFVFHRQSSGFFSINSMSIKADNESIAGGSSCGSLCSHEMHGSAMLLAAVGEQFNDGQGSFQQLFATPSPAADIDDHPSPVVLARTFSLSKFAEFDMW